MSSFTSLPLSLWNLRFCIPIYAVNVLFSPNFYQIPFLSPVYTGKRLPNTGYTMYMHTCMYLFPPYTHTTPPTHTPTHTCIPTHTPTHIPHMHSHPPLHTCTPHHTVLPPHPYIHEQNWIEEQEKSLREGKRSLPKQPWWLWLWNKFKMVLEYIFE